MSLVRLYLLLAILDITTTTTDEANVTDVNPYPFYYALDTTPCTDEKILIVVHSSPKVNLNTQTIQVDQPSFEYYILHFVAAPCAPTYPYTKLAQLHKCCGRIPSYNPQFLG